jgi:AcrR family transcriptional regulator
MLIDMVEKASRTRLSREETQAQTRERLLRSARKEVANKGAAASVRDIAEAAGYSQGALYANFGSKEGLLLELMRRHMQEEAATLTAILGGAEGDAEVALSGLESWAGSLHADADWAALAIELDLHARRSEAFAAEYREVQSAHSQALGRLLSRLFKLMGLVPPGDPVELAAGLMALAHGLALRETPASRNAGKTIMIFFRALIESAQAHN